MKHLRIFDSVADLNAAIANSTIGMIGLAYNGSTPVMKKKDAPSGPDYSIPFYIDVRGAVELRANSSLQISSDGETWADITTETTLPTGKTYLRAKTDQSEPLEPIWEEDTNSDYDIGGNINSLVKVNFENDTNAYSFQGFFMSKQKLKSAGDLILPATTLIDDCYETMFQYCHSLTTAPALPATTLADSCYRSMFDGCTSLTTAPALSATTLAYYCCDMMFRGCTSLTAAPALPATTLAIGCYNQMFIECTALTTAPALPATTLTGGCYSGMFKDCTSLTTPPALPVTTLTESCYSEMFSGCTSLTTAPTLPATTLASSCYGYMFSGCTSLTTAPTLPATTLAIYCYGYMFNGCISLTTPPALPVTTLANGCYSGMFKGCTSLTTAPELPATTLPEECYNEMFNGCTNLNYIKCLATDISTRYCTLTWVSSVASTGTFVKNPSMSSWTEGANGIPAGWTVQDATA